jgi:hypothetical protein
MRSLILLLALALPTGAQNVPLTLAAQQHGAAGGGIVINQFTSTFCVAATTCAKAFTSTVGSGHTLIYAVGGAGCTPTATTDNNTNSIANALTFVGNGSERIDTVSLSNSGSTTVTAHCNTSGQLHIHIWEVTGLTGALDQSGTTTQTATSLTVSTSSPTTTTNDLVFGFFFDNSNDYAFTPGSGFSPSQSTLDATDNDAALSEVKVVSSIGTQTATATITTSSAMDNIVAAFQGSNFFTPIQNITSASCSSASTACSATVGSTTAGNLLVITVMWPGGVARTLSSITGGESTGMVLPSGCYMGPSGGSVGENIACAYKLSATGGVTTITANLSGTPSGAWAINVREYHPSTVTAVLDGTPASNVTTSCSNNCSPPALTLTGGSDVVVAGMTSDNAGCGVAAGYANFSERTLSGNSVSSADNLNTPSGAAAIFTQGTACPTAAAGAKAAMAIAFK